MTDETATLHALKLLVRELYLVEALERRDNGESWLRETIFPIRPEDAKQSADDTKAIGAKLELFFGEVARMLP